MFRGLLGLLAYTTVTATILLANGCVQPLSRDIEQSLRETLIHNNQTYLTAVRDAQLVEVHRPPSLVEKDLEKRMDKIDKISGLGANALETMELGQTLTGSEQVNLVSMTLEQVIKLAVTNNLNIRLARLAPAIRDTQITQREAVFDAIYFARFDFSKLDTPQPPTLGGFGVFGSVRQDTRTLETGIRKTLGTGGQVTVSTQLTRNYRNPSFFTVSNYFDADVLVSLEQPLLRNFGRDITRSQILLSENARDQSIADLRQSLLTTIGDTEQIYWDLVAARHALLIEQRLYRGAQAALKKMEARRIYDASSVQISDQRAFVAEARFRVLQARQAVFESSDRLKAFAYAPDLSLAGDDVIVPIDKMVDEPIRFNVHEAYKTALQNRPDMQRALSQINDATILQRVADNQRLPVLDLTSSITFNGLSTQTETDTYENLEDGDFIDYLLSLLFEMPIGNRAGEAAYSQRKIERLGAVINYQRTAQNAIFEVKQALRELDTQYESIGAAREARIAQANLVRARRAQVEFGHELTPAFIDLKIRGEQNLSTAEIAEVNAIRSYNVAIARFHQAVGTLLKRNGIDFDPEMRAGDYR